MVRLFDREVEGLGRVLADASRAIEDLGRDLHAEDLPAPEGGVVLVGATDLLVAGEVPIGATSCA